MTDNVDDLAKLAEQGRWNEIIAGTGKLDPVRDTVSFSWFVRGQAFIEIGKPLEAIKPIQQGLTLAPQSRWGNKILFDALIDSKSFTEAFRSFNAFIAGESGVEQEKAWFIEKATETGFLDVAARMNATRTVIAEVGTRPQHALVIQCFEKCDTLDKVLASAARLDSSEAFSLYIIQDQRIDPDGVSSSMVRQAEVRNTIAQWLPELMTRFYSVEVLCNRRNLGTAPTCKRILDYVTERHGGFIYVEDDCVLDRSALDWTRHHLANTITPTGAWFVSCESIFFDSQGQSANDRQLGELRRIAAREDLRNAFLTIDYVPSTCFATTAEIWKLCSNIRGFTRGPESLSRFMAAMNRKTVVPVVPRASDIGMLHPLGYSINLAGRSQVRETKTTLLMADAIFDVRGCAAFPGDKDMLFRATSKLDAHAMGVMSHS